MDTDDLKFMRQAIDASRKCRPEDERKHPKVGAVVVKAGRVIATAFRGEGEVASGEHAEFTVLEKKLGGDVLVGSTVYTTLEPCTTRNHPKIPCAERLIERKVARVVIGILDPNPQIRGKGQLRLREAGITTELFSSELMAEIEELNREFIRFQKRQDEGRTADAEFIEKNQARRLDDWYRGVNVIYWNRNFSLGANAIFAHLVEMIGGLSTLASNKSKAGVDPETHIVKAIAWWLALCGKLGVKSVEDLLWDKFPGRCPYCQEIKHDPGICSEKKATNPGPPWNILSELGKQGERPKRLSEWQNMFLKIYPAQHNEYYGPSFACLAEEMGELAEAIRVFSAAPGYFLSEAADVFAWLMHIQNIIDQQKKTPLNQRGKSLEVGFCRTYPDSCRDCGKKTCSCPPILPSTVGRIAHEVPPGRGSFDSAGRFMTPDLASKFFNPIS